MTCSAIPTCIGPFFKFRTQHVLLRLFVAYVESFEDEFVSRRGARANRRTVSRRLRRWAAEHIVTVEPFKRLKIHSSI